MNAKQRFLKKVWPRVGEFFDRFGPANYKGYIGVEEQGWFGPYIWSENGDTVRVITKFCEEEFGFLNVHNESKIDKFMFANFEKGEGTKSIDIDITDASGCENDEALRELKHTLFIEVKHAFKASSFIFDVKRRISGFEQDCQKLQVQINKGRCQHAIAILIDDGDGNGKPYVANANAFMGGLKANYPGVEPLIWQKKPSP
jgi:hypothetical protein